MDLRDNRQIQKLRQRDAKAFEEMVRTHQSLIFNLLYRIIGNREEAEDLLQEVFVTVFKQIDSFRGESSLTTWIYRIATNHCINRQKYLHRRMQHARDSLNDMTDKQQFNGHGAIGSRVPRPDEMVEGLEMEHLLQSAISSLDEEFRIVLVLRDVQNLSYEEIEQIIGVPVGTVKSRLHRARMSLKEKLSSGTR